jgi:hypothetical protein
MNFGITSEAAPRPHHPTLPDIPDGACGIGVIVDGPLAGGDRALFVGICCDQAGIDGKPLATNQTFRHTPFDDALEQMAQDVAIAEAAMSVAGECRVIRDFAIEANGGRTSDRRD